MGFFSFFSKEKKETLDKGLSKTKESVFGKIARAIAGKSKVDDEVLDNLEEVLITSDVGVETTLKIIERIEKRAADEKYMNAKELNVILRDEIAALLTENNSDDVDDFETPVAKKPYVIMVVGVNGVGKTTTKANWLISLRKPANPFIWVLPILSVRRRWSSWLSGANVWEFPLSSRKWVLTLLLWHLIL